jgi:hypothetical protein|tara:strand:+ start:1261 stop:2016 length:756 start_codon:yes stop_codon:yes gene_type:complete
MPLWGKSTSAESRPKWLPTDSDATDASGAREDAFATTGGWALRPGQGNSGNDNTSAQPEVLVAMRNLSSTLGAANLLSVDWDATTTLAHDGTGRFDMVYTFDEAVTVTSAAWSADQVSSNKVYVGLQVVGPTDMANDGAFVMQYYSGSGTNTLTFRGVIPSAGVTDGYITDLNGTYAMATDGSSAVVDGNGTTVTAVDGDHDGGSAVAGVDGSTELFGTGITKTGSSINTLTTQAGSSSGSTTILTGVQLA